MEAVLFFACRHGQDDTLKFKSGVRMRKKGDLSNFAEDFEN